MTKHRFKLILRIFLFVGTVVSMFYVPWPIVRAWFRPTPATITQQVNSAAAYGFDGIMVYVQQGHKPAQFYASGYKNKENKVAATPYALFKIASVGKLYDAVAVAQLVNAGSLSLSKTLVQYLPHLKGKITNADKITLRMLVQHKSGIFNVTNTPGFWENPPKNNKEAIQLAYNLPASFAPGQQYEYCNTNYMLIAQIIEKVTGADRFAYIEQHILKPLNLKNTYASIHDVDLDKVMSGYYVGVPQDIKADYYGSMVATAQDVGIFLKALNTGTLLSPREMSIYASIYKFEHTGLIPGYQTIAHYYKDIDAVVVQMVNTTNFDGYNWTLGEMMYSRIVKILRNNLSQKK